MPRKVPSSRPKSPRPPVRGTDERVGDALARATGADGPRALKIPLPTDADAIGSEKYWAEQIEDAEDRRGKEIPTWRVNLERYTGARPHLNGVPNDDVINVNSQFSHVENKKPNLFFQRPDLQVTATRNETQIVAPLVKAILNKYLGEDFIDADDLMDETMNSILITAGEGPTKIGYESVKMTKLVPTGRMEHAIDPLTGQPALELDPMTGQPAIDPQTGQPKVRQQLAIDPATGQPEQAQKSFVVYSRYYWDAFSPDALLKPVGLISSRYDKSPWLGWEFTASAEELERKYGVDTLSLGDIDWEKKLVLSNDKAALMKQSVCTGKELWYRASLYDPAISNPEHIRRLVFLKTKSGRGQNGYTAVVHEDSPFQEIDPDTGKLVRGMRGYPIHVFTIRTQPETSYVKSDCTILRDAADERTMGRTQMVQQRKRSMPLRGYNTRSVAIDQVTTQDLERAEYQGMVKFKGPISDGDFKVLDIGHFPQENFAFDRITERDLARLGGLGMNAQGVPTEGIDSATESANIARATDARLAKERKRLAKQYVRGCKKLLSLIQMFATEEDVIELEGAEGQQRWATWNRDTIRGEFGFTFNPDSALRIDASQNRELILRFANVVTNNPFFNQNAVARAVAEAFGQDYEKFKGPGPKPPNEAPKLSYSFKGEDFDPASPQFRGVVFFLKTQGIDLMQAFPEYGGAVPPPSVPAVNTSPVKAARGVPPVDQHSADLNARRPGPRPLT